MSVFPQFSQQYYTDEDKEITSYMECVYQKNITINQMFWSEANLDARFAAGDTRVWGEIYGPIPGKTRQLSFNRIRRILNMITGYQRQHRKSTQAMPIENSDTETADQFTKLLYSVNTQTGALEMLSDAFQGAVTCGMNLLSCFLDYRRDPNGDFVIDNLSYDSFLIDPFFKKKNLSDCESIWMRKYVSKTQAKTMLPDRAHDIDLLQGCGNRDGKFNFIPQATSYISDKLLTYDEFYYLDSRKQKLLIDTETGETYEWRGKEEDLKDFLSFYDQIIESETEIPTVKLAIVVQGIPMYNGPNPLGIDRYPFVPVWCYYDQSIAPSSYDLRVQGVTRGLKDAQWSYNRRRQIELDILESQINSGFKYKTNALVNLKDVFMTGQGRGLALNPEAQMSDVEQIMPPQIPPSMLQLSEILGNEISNISGVNEELLGSAQDDKAGILSMLRQGAGLTTLQSIFDNLDQSQKLLGQLMVDIIQANWTPGKVARVLGEEPSQQFYSRSFSKYDITVEEAPLTATQKQLALQQAVYLRELGIQIPSTYFVENMQLPGKKELIEQITASEQSQNEAQQKMQDMQIQQLQVDNETKLSYAEAEKSLAAERMNKLLVDETLALERLGKTKEERTSAILNIAKTIKELEQMDISKLASAVQLLQTIQKASGQESSAQDIAENVEDRLTEQIQGNLQPEANLSS